jgi:hypothetical protein
VRSRGAIHIHAAQGHHAAGETAESVHQLLRLTARAENKIDNYIKLLPPEFQLMVLEKLAVPSNLVSALGHTGLAAMEHRNAVAALSKLRSREAPDKAAATDQKSFHRPKPSTG